MRDHIVGSTTEQILGNARQTSNISKETPSTLEHINLRMALIKLRELFFALLPMTQEKFEAEIEAGNIEISPYTPRNYELLYIEYLKGFGSFEDQLRYADRALGPFAMRLGLSTFVEQTDDGRMIMHFRKNYKSLMQITISGPTHENQSPTTV